ncbi:MAG: spore germination protein [Clostridia bacterium]|nr:spore germination protein [Clostridia bacterium]
MVFITDFDRYMRELTDKLYIGQSFDMVKRTITLDDDRRCGLFYVSSFVDNSTMELVLEYFIRYKDTDKLAERVAFGEVSESTDTDTAVTAILSGGTAFVIEGMDKIILIFCRRYPNRSIEEPDNEKVLKGPRDGFGESMINNTALIRRRIRDPKLTFELAQCGKRTKTDIAVCYIEDKVDKRFLATVMKKLNSIDLEAVSFGEQSIAEQLVRQRWYNPFPKVRFTERPDSAAAMVLEGSIIIISDNTPEVLILPTSIFDFLQEADDFYLPPLTATYFRVVRLIILLLTLFMLPAWYLLVSNPEYIPQWLSILKIKEQAAIPVIVQIFMIEFIIDGLKLASLNTPQVLGNSFSVIAGLILGEMAVNIGWFVPEVILYLAFITIANFTQPSYELAYSLKFMRLILLILSAVFNIWGFGLGVILVFLLIVSNKTVDNSRGYLYPLIPWNGNAMLRFFVRVRLKNKTSSK